MKQRSTCYTIRQYLTTSSASREQPRPAEHNGKSATAPTYCCCPRQLRPSATTASAQHPTTRRFPRLPDRSSATGISTNLFRCIMAVPEMTIGCLRRRRGRIKTLHHLAAAKTGPSLRECSRSPSACNEPASASGCRPQERPDARPGSEQESRNSPEPCEEDSLRTADQFLLGPPLKETSRADAARARLAWINALTIETPGPAACRVGGQPAAGEHASSSGSDSHAWRTLPLSQSRPRPAHFHDDDHGGTSVFDGRAPTVLTQSASTPTAVTGNSRHRDAPQAAESLPREWAARRSHAIDVAR